MGQKAILNKFQKVYSQKLWMEHSWKHQPSELKTVYGKINHRFKSLGINSFQYGVTQDRSPLANLFPVLTVCSFHLEKDGSSNSSCYHLLLITSYTSEKGNDITDIIPDNPSELSIHPVIFLHEKKGATPSPQKITGRKEMHRLKHNNGMGHVSYHVHLHVFL